MEPEFFFPRILNPEEIEQLKGWEIHDALTERGVYTESDWRPELKKMLLDLEKERANTSRPKDEELKAMGLYPLSELKKMSNNELVKISKKLNLSGYGNRTSLINNIYRRQGDSEANKIRELEKENERIKAEREYRRRPLVESPKLPRDVLFKIALALDLPDLLSYCLTSKSYNDAACKNPDFWRARLLKEKQTLLRDKDIQSIKDPKEYYEKQVKKYKGYLSKKLTEFAKSGELDKAKRAVELGADINYETVDGNEFNTPLTYAANNGHFDVVKYLIEHGADKNDYYLATALVESVKNRHNEIAIYLVEQGANTAFDKDLAIRWALTNNDKELADYLERKAKYYGL